jgi:hypothetical protein
MKLLSVKEDNCKFDKNKYLDVTVLRKTPSPSINYTVNEVNDDEATVKRGFSPVTSLKIDESPSIEKKTQKRTYRSFRKL